MSNTEASFFLSYSLFKFQDPAEADKLLKIQRELDETKIILVSIVSYFSYILIALTVACLYDLSNSGFILFSNFNLIILSAEGFYLIKGWHIFFCCNFLYLSDQK